MSIIYVEGWVNGLEHGCQGQTHSGYVGRNKRVNQDAGHVDRPVSLNDTYQ